MADNTVLNLGAGGDVIASDDIAGVKYQIVKIAHGLADVAPVHASATNPMPSVALGNGLVSTSNSSAVNLAAAAVFTGIGEDVSEYASIVVSLFSSHASATDGLSIQQSTNNTDWDHTDVFNIPAASGKSFSVPVQGRFFRVVYTNGATLTTAFRLQTLFHKQSKKGSAVRPQDGRSNDNDLEEVSGNLMLFNGTSWDRARGTTLTGQLVEVSRINELRASTLHVTATAAVNTASTCSLPAPGVGLFNYVTSVQLVKLYAVIGVASGAGVVVTSTNLPGTPTWTTEQAAGPAGTAPRVIDYQPTTPLKSATANTATTFVAPLQLQTIWRWNISYFTAA